MSYNEILKEVSVAKSTLSLWLRDVGLSKSQNQKLTEKRLVVARKGAQKRKEMRIISSRRTVKIAKEEIRKISQRDLWLIGVTLYWAEGTKQKEYYPSNRVSFCNSDPYLIKVYLEWILKICKISKKDIIFRIYLHENSSHRLREVQEFWSEKTGFGISNFFRVS